MKKDQAPVVKDIHIADEIRIGDSHCQLYTLSDVDDLPALCGPRITYDKYSTDKTKFSTGFATPIGTLLKCNHLYNLLSTHYTNIVDNVYEYALGSQTQQMETTAGTVFGAYNSVIGYFQNVRSFKSDEATFKSIMDGTAKHRVQTAFNLCRDFATHGSEALIYN